MNRKKCLFLASTMLAFTLSACGTDPQLTQFKNDLNSFCDTVAEIDDSLNKIDAESDNAADLALDYLDKLEGSFADFADLDFPADYDYLEPVADEAYSYMQEAVSNYHLAYSDENFNEETANYARENSARAFKRVQVILDIVRGNVTVSEDDLN